MADIHLIEQTNASSGPGLLEVDGAGAPAISNNYYNKDEVDDLLGGINFDYFFTDTAEGIIAGYNTMVPSDTGEVESTVFASIPAADTLIKSFVTEVNEPQFTNLLAGIYELHIHAAKTAGTKDVLIYGEFYKRASGGTETLLGTSENSAILTGSNTEYGLHFSIASDEILLSDDRLVVKFYGTPSGAGSDPTVTLFLEGLNNSRVEVKTDSGFLEGTFLTKAGVSGGQTASGGTATTESMILKANTVDSGQIELDGTKAAITGAMSVSTLNTANGIVRTDGSGNFSTSTTLSSDTITNASNRPGAFITDALNATEQANAYYVSQNGNDSNNGKSVANAFLTIGAANTAIAARTPTATNIFAVYLIDGIFEEDFTAQPYTIYEGNGVAYKGEIVAVDNASVRFKRWDGKSSGGTRMITKTTGGGVFRVNVLEDMALNDSDTVFASVGFVNIEADQILYGASNIVAAGSANSTIVLYCDNKILSLSGTGKIDNAGAVANLNVQIFANFIEDGGTGGAAIEVSGSGVSSFVDITTNKIISLNRKLFDVGNLGVIDASPSRFSEAVPSTATGSGKLKLNILNEESNSNKSRLKNDDGIEIDGPTVVKTGNTFRYEVNPTFSDPKDIVDKNYVDTAPVGHLQKDNVYYVNKAGNDSNSGLSQDDPLLTIGAAITKVNAESPIPGFTNWYDMKVIGGGNYVEDFAMPRFATLDASGATLGGNVTGVQDSVIKCAGWNAPTTGAQINIAMSGAQPDGMHVYVESFFIGGTLEGVNNTSNGAIHFHFGGNQFHFSGNFIPTTNTGNIYVHGREIVIADPAVIWANINSSMELYLDCDLIHNNSSSSSSVIINATGACFIHGRVNRMLSDNGKIYALSSGPVMDLICNKLDEAVASTVSAADVNLMVTRDDDDGMQLRNRVSGVTIDAGAAGNTVVLDAAGAVTTMDNLTVAHVQPTITFNDSVLNSQDFSFVNLTTTPVSMGIFASPGSFEISIVTPDPHNAILTVKIGLQTSVAYSHGAFNASPNMTVTPGVAGSFTLALAGAANNFVLAWNTGSNDGSLATSSGTATGTTTLRIVRLTP